jgi:methyl-accepting chemotaxis protein
VDDSTKTQLAARLREVTSMQLPKLDNETILLAFAVVTGLAVLLQTILLLVISVAVRKAASAIREEIQDLRSSITPVLFDTRDLLTNAQTSLANAQEFLTNTQVFFNRVAPKVETATTDLVQITHTLRLQSVEFQSSATEILERVRRQSIRVDEMFSSLLNTVDRAGGFVVQSVSKPVQQVSGMLRAAKAIIDSLRGPLGQRRTIQPRERLD